MSNHPTGQYHSHCSTLVAVKSKLMLKFIYLFFSSSSSSLSSIVWSVFSNWYCLKAATFIFIILCVCVCVWKLSRLNLLSQNCYHSSIINQCFMSNKERILCIWVSFPCYFIIWSGNLNSTQLFTTHFSSIGSTPASYLGAKSCGFRV